MFLIVCIMYYAPMDKPKSLDPIKFTFGLMNVFLQTEIFDCQNFVLWYYYPEMYDGCVFFMAENREISVDIPKHESKPVSRENCRT